MRPKKIGKLSAWIMTGILQAEKEAQSRQPQPVELNSAMALEVRKS